jgi:hypothetical protein
MTLAEVESHLRKNDKIVRLAQEAGKKDEATILSYASPAAGILTPTPSPARAGFATVSPSSRHSSNALHLASTVDRSASEG